MRKAITVWAVIRELDNELVDLYFSKALAEDAIPEKYRHSPRSFLPDRLTPSEAEVPDE